MCGVVDGGIVSGLYGYEAGQSGVRDIFAWYVKNQVPARYHDETRAAGVDIHEYLTDLAQSQPVGGHELSGTIVGLTLGTRPEEIYRALLESTAFGTRTIVEAFAASGIPVTEFIVAGGLLKNPFLMQGYSDVLRMPISTIASDKGSALGSAMHAAVAAGAYDRLYAEYMLLHDYFGRGGNDVMHRLTALRREGFLAGHDEPAAQGNSAQEKGDHA